MTSKTKIGILPLYLKLYDDIMPERREAFFPFIDHIKEMLAEQDLEVVGGDICRIAPEFEAAIASFEAQGVEAIVTLHLAYSPSLESIPALCKTDLPLLILDTTMDASFDCSITADRIMYNHGIHGVMDLASMLRRHKRPFHIVADHVSTSNVISRAALLLKAMVAGKSFRSGKVLRIGETFPGMGDFSIPEEAMKETLGIEVTQLGLAEVAEFASAVSAADIAAEIEADREVYDVRCPNEVLERSIRSGLTVRACLEQGGYHAFSQNFLAFDTPDGPLGTVPFLECSKAMARGVGYAGEGDVLTAALVGSLAKGFGQTTFTEIFCPDWSGDTLFLSHMGEISPTVLQEKAAILEKDYPFSAAQNPAYLTGRAIAGQAIFVNLAPGPDNSFSLIAAPVEIIDDSSEENLENAVKIWMQPHCEIGDFLEQYSKLGGTHHSALVLGSKLEGIETFAKTADLPLEVIF